MLAEKYIKTNSEWYAQTKCTGGNRAYWAEVDFSNGAIWANEQNAQEIAELKDIIRNLNITIENAAEWSEKQAAEIAELVDALRKAHFRLEKGFEYSDPDIVAILTKYEK